MNKKVDMSLFIFKIDFRQYLPIHNKKWLLYVSKDKDIGS